MMICNGRVLTANLTGIQRYTQEILARIPMETIIPTARMRGVMGHAWDQAVLPTRLNGKMLWSPSNTGPLLVRNQIVTLHDLATYDAPEGFSGSFRAAYRMILPRLLPRVKAVITVSEFTRQRALEEFRLDPALVHVTPLAADASRFNPRSKAECEAVKAKLGIRGRYILFLGALSARKNVGRLVQAWAQAQHEVDDDITLVIAGGAGAGHVFDGTTLPALPPRTQLTGRVADEDLPALLSGAALFAFPSLYEGFGLPPLEAMACGTPCVVSNITSLPEVTGSDAALVDPTSVQSIADGLVSVLGNPALAKKLSAAGLARAKQFSWDKTAAQTKAIFQKYA